MRVAIWGNLTVHSSAPQVQRGTHMTHFMGRHQLMSTHEDAQHTFTETCACISVYVHVTYVKLDLNMQECTHTYTHYLPITPTFACLYGGIFPNELNRLIERCRRVRWEQGEEKQLMWQWQKVVVQQSWMQSIPGLIMLSCHREMSHYDTPDHVMRFRGELTEIVFFLLLFFSCWPLAVLQY